VKYRKKPVVIDAWRWWKKGDAPEEARIHPLDADFDWRCDHCGRLASEHGNCPTLEGYHIVCPGDWIIRGVKGEYYPCKPDIFALTYEEAEHGE
jgi:hypothetical protein